MNNRITPEQIKALRALCAERNPGSWELAFSVVVDVVPELLDEIERLQKERDAANKRVADIGASVESVAHALCYGQMRELSAACSELWQTLDQSGNAPSGAGSEGESAYRQDKQK